MHDFPVSRQQLYWLRRYSVLHRCPPVRARLAGQLENQRRVDRLRKPRHLRRRHRQRRPARPRHRALRPVRRPHREGHGSRSALENPKVYKDFEKLLAAPDIDAVIIATPPFEHPRMLDAAVEAKKHVYCEKPMGVDLAGVKTSIAASRKAGSQEEPVRRLPAALRPGVPGSVQAPDRPARSANW